jgi:TonB family protein
VRGWPLVPAVIAALAIVAPATRAFAQPEGARQPDAPPPAAKAPVMTKPPQLLQAVAPEYPPAALAAGKQADVKVKIHVDETGVVTAVDVAAPVGDGFDEAAQAAAMQYVFDPAEFDGKPGPIVVETVIHFVIDKQSVQVPVEPPPTAPPPGAPPPPGHAGDMKQPITIRGQVLELGTRRKLPGTIVSVAELGLDAVTDENGEFAFHGVAPGTYRVIAVSDKYDRLERPVYLAAGEVNDLTLRLRPLNANPYQTVVEGEREVIEVTRRKLTREQLTSVPGTFGDPIRAIQALPGVARSPFGVGVLVIRGSNPNATGIFIDGHRVPGIFHFLGGPSILNPEFLDSIELYPGGFPARFGRLYGGVVAIETRPSKSDGVHGAASVDILNAAGYLRAPITKDLSFAVAARRSYLDFMLALLVPEPTDGSQQLIVPYYYDAQARVDWNLHENGRASVLALVSSDQLRVVSAPADQAQSLQLNSSIDFFRVIGNYTRPLAGDLKLTISPAVGRDRVVFSGSNAAAMGPYTQLQVMENTLSYRARVNGHLDKHLYLDSGIDYESRVTYYDILAAIDPNIRGAVGANLPLAKINRGISQVSVGLHADLAIDLGRLRLVPGLRSDSMVLAGQTRQSFDPRIVARYTVDPEWTAKAYAGIFHQPPQPESFDTRFGNPQISIERGVHTGAGFEFKPDHLWTIDAELYYVRRTGLTQFTTDATVYDDGSVQPKYWDNIGDGWTYGVEAMIKREISERAYGWLSYSFSRTLQRFDQDAKYFSSSFDQPHVLNAVASYKLGGGWEIGARERLSSGSPTTVPTGVTFDADNGNYVRVVPETRNARNPFFEQTDVRIEHSWLFDTWSLGLYLDVQNVFNRTNVEAYQYDYRYRERAPVSSVPFLPTLGVRGSW